MLETPVEVHVPWMLITPRPFSIMFSYRFLVFFRRSFPLDGDFLEELVRPGPWLYKTSNPQQHGLPVVCHAWM